MEKMRLIVLLDMPASTRHERKVKREFLEWLFAAGFATLQDGVFTRVCRGRANAKIHESNLRSHRPESGMVRFFTLTEEQFENGELLVGHELPQEDEIGSQLDIFL